MKERKKHPLSNNPTTDAELLAQCNEWLYYDSIEGSLQWKKKAAQCVKVGDEAGILTEYGYIRITLYGHQYKAHHLGFLMVNKYLPEWPDVVDHEDENKSHNWIANLRHATFVQNIDNTGPRGGKSKYKGVNPNGKNPKGKKWKTEMKAAPKIYLGIFNCEHAAARTWNTAARMYQGHKFCYTNEVKTCDCSECN